MWYLHAIDNYSAVSGNGLLIRTVCMNLTFIMLRERNQILKGSYSTFQFIYNLRKFKLLYIDRRHVGGCPVECDREKDMRLLRVVGCTC